MNGRGRDTYGAGGASDSHAQPDLSLEVGKEKYQVQVHSQHLTLHSSVFRMLLPYYKAHGRLLLPEDDADAFRLIYRFLTPFVDTDEPPELTISNVEDVLMLAHKYDIRPVLTRCWEFARDCVKQLPPPDDVFWCTASEERDAAFANVMKFCSYASSFDDEQVLRETADYLAGLLECLHSTGDLFCRDAVHCILSLVLPLVGPHPTGDPCRLLRLELEKIIDGQDKLLIDELYSEGDDKRPAIEAIVFHIIREKGVSSKLEEKLDIIEFAKKCLQYLMSGDMAKDLYECMPHGSDNNAFGRVEARARWFVDRLAKRQYDAMKDQFESLGVVLSSGYLDSVNDDVQVMREAVFHLVKQKKERGASAREIFLYTRRLLDRNDAPQVLTDSLDGLVEDGAIVTSDSGQTYVHRDYIT